MLRLSAFVLLSVLMIGHAVAGGKPVAGRFDYYVLSLGWAPSWCSLTGNARGAAECRPARKAGFLLHGLWPQFNRGWPSFCNTARRAPNRRETAEMADLMGSSGAAWHQWDKHGRCSGLSGSAYFRTARTAYERINRPAILRQILRPITLPAPLIKTAFLKSNPALGANMIAVTCKQGYFQEVRICLNKDLSPRQCGVDVLRGCQQRVTFPPLR